MRDVYIDKLKGIAILSVLLAHTNLKFDFITNLNLINNYIIKNFTTVGVPIFFMLSGYFYKNDNIKNTLKNKINLLKAWFFTGTLIFFYVYLRKGELNIVNWLRWLFGVYTYLYFMVLMFYFFIIEYLSQKYQIINILNYIFFIINYIYVIPQITDYLNPYNFYIYFFIGIKLKKYNYFYKFLDKLRKNRKKMIGIYMIYVVFIIRNKYQISSFGITSLVGIFLLSSIIMTFSTNRINYLATLGKNTLYFYLTHMLVIGILNRVFIENYILRKIAVLIPILVILVLYLLKAFIVKISKKFQIDFISLFGIIEGE